jgi:MFS family permease
MAQAELGTVETKIPARMDRLPWARFHWMIVAGLGTVWILDGLEVTMVGSVATRLTEDGSGISLDAGDIGTAAAIYVAGACTGALIFGQLTDRFGRKRLFLATLLLYLAATVATAFSFSPWYFFLMRFLTGAGIGGEYAAINSAIDELIPARVRGRVDLVINGSYWLGAAIGALAALFFLNKGVFAADVGWRLAFGVGALLGVAILLVRRHVPESPRWLFIHGREEEAEAIVDRIERGVEEDTEQRLEEPDESITVRQRRTIPFRTIARTAFKVYPKRTALGLALFVGQAFLYNAFTFDLGTLLSEFYDVASGSVPYFFAIFAFGNFLGPLLLGRLFDTVGRKPMIAFAYFGASVMTVLLAILFVGGGLTEWSFLALVVATFFIASAGASAAYLTVSEIFPMETRALSIAFFYAVGTAVGGITGPLLFGHLIESGDRELMAIGFYVAAGIMAVGGVAELLFGVKAEQESLENIAKPLTAEEAEQDADGGPPSEEQPAKEQPAEEQPEEVQEAVRRSKERIARIEQRERLGARRYRPGPGRTSSSPGMWVSGRVERQALDAEVEMIARALAERGPLARAEVARAVGARFWGPGRFSAALREAVDEGVARRVGRNRFGPPAGA